MAKKAASKNEVIVTEPKNDLTTDMAEVTRKVALAGSEKIVLGAKFNVLLLYDIGALINEVFTDPVLKKTKTVDDELKKLLKFWGHPSWNLTSLYDLRNVSVTFSRDAIKQECDIPMSNGKLLTWSHFKELQKVGQEKRRIALLKKIRENSLSANELILELQGNKESTVKRAGGRKPSIPKTPTAVIQKLSSTVQHTDNYLQSIMEPFEVMLEEQADKLDSKFIDNLTETLDQLVEMETRLHDAAGKLTSLKEKLVNGEAETEEEEEVEVEETTASGASVDEEADDEEVEADDEEDNVNKISSVEGTSSFALDIEDEEEDDVVPVVAAKSTAKVQKHKLAGKAKK